MPQETDGENPRQQYKHHDAHLGEDNSRRDGNTTPIQTIRGWRNYVGDSSKPTSVALIREPAKTKAAKKSVHNHSKSSRSARGHSRSAKPAKPARIPRKQSLGSLTWKEIFLSPPGTPIKESSGNSRTFTQRLPSKQLNTQSPVLYKQGHTSADESIFRRTSTGALSSSSLRDVSSFTDDASDNTNRVLSHSLQHDEMHDHFPRQSTRRSACLAVAMNGPPPDSPSVSCCDNAYSPQSSESPLRRFSFDKPLQFAIDSTGPMANKKTHKVAAGVIPPTLPPSVEEAYRKKCVELKRRMAEVEQSNDSFRLRKNRLLRGIRKIRLERTILLDLLGKRMRKNGDDGYYDDDSENSSEIPATPNDKPLRNKRSHRRTVASSPPMLSQQVPGPIVAPHQHRQSALAPYQPHHEISFSTVQTPNGISHLQSHPSHPELYSTHNLLPSAESQIHYPASAFEYFLDDQFYQSAQAQNFRTEEELIEAGHIAWSKLSAEQIDTYVEHWTHNLTRWRQAMEEVALQTGEPPRGQPAGRLDGAQRRDSDTAPRDREAERQRDIEMEDHHANEDKRVGSSGFTSIN